MVTTNYNFLNKRECFFFVCCTCTPVGIEPMTSSTTLLLQGKEMSYELEFIGNKNVVIRWIIKIVTLSELLKHKLYLESVYHFPISCIGHILYCKIHEHGINIYIYIYIYIQWWSHGRLICHDSTNLSTQNLFLWDPHAKSNPIEVKVVWLLGLKQFFIWVFILLVLLNYVLRDKLLISFPMN